MVPSISVLASSSGGEKVGEGTGSGTPEGRISVASGTFAACAAETESRQTSPPQSCASRGDFSMSEPAERRRCGAYKGRMVGDVARLLLLTR
ncbi:hypothetical protein Amal_03854 [Acetobacter malorum]|uniref:Uncharacterized protein n=1 Tax=Acetobacter malorum TaxID=178901 RepID=A0A177G3Q1_9PROT|nr:hypothetical protein Amal_03854 [Acetobacter malorum]